MFLRKQIVCNFKKQNLKYFKNRKKTDFFAIQKITMLGNFNWHKLNGAYKKLFLS